MGRDRPRWPSAVGGRRLGRPAIDAGAEKDSGHRVGERSIPAELLATFARMKILKVCPPLLLILAVGAVTGCGSNSSGTTTSSSASYTNAAAAICTAAFNKVNAQSLPTTSAGAKAVQTNSAELFNAAVAKLSQVDVPADSSAQFNAWLTDFKAIPAANEAAAAAADQGATSAAFIKTGVQFETAVAKANASAKAAGLPGCELTK